MNLQESEKIELSNLKQSIEKDIEELADMKNTKHDYMDEKELIADIENKQNRINELDNKKQLTEADSDELTDEDMKDIINSLVSSGNYTLNQLSFLLMFANRKFSTKAQLEYLVTKADKMSSNDVTTLQLILRDSNNTKIIDHILDNNFTSSQISEIRHIQAMHLLTDAQFELIVYSNITDSKKLNTLADNLSSGKWTVDEAKAMLQNEVEEHSIETNESNISKAANQLAEILEDEISLQYGWEIDDMDYSISGTLDDDFTLDIELVEDNNKIIFIFNNNKYTDINKVAKDVIKSGNSYIKAVMDNYNEYPNYVNM